MLLKPSIKHFLGVGSDFNQPTGQVVWPPSLAKISFGERFDQSIDDVSWPASLRHLAFSRGFSFQSEGFEWPASLQQGTVACAPNDSLPAWSSVQVSGCGIAVGREMRVSAIG
ncbi:unnamed protein product [Ectocarpus sp. 8 AP-2014]